jgi:UDP-N-acetylglucosamine--N-acetylmuramyl-(pentapeptide) pyrophosphoryl-undecaprenol N-acetylglucosamine transferase
MKIVFACGGTGGHVFPAISIADEFKSKPDTSISFAGRRGSMEEKLVAKDWEFDEIQAVPLHRGKLFENLLLPVKLLRSVLSAFKVLNTRKPDCIIATGGYVSLPIILAGRLKGIPIYLQEQNAVAGIANKIGAKFAKRVFVTSEAAQKQFPEGLSENLGNPIRDIANIDAKEINTEYPETEKMVLILGGSQGALGINTKIDEIVSKLESRGDIKLVWQVGQRNLDSFQEKYKDSKTVKVFGFLNNIYGYIERADLETAQAGGG